MGDYKGALQVSPKVHVGLAYFEIRFVTPIVGEVSLGPLGNTHHISLASTATNMFVVR